MPALATAALVAGAVKIGSQILSNLVGNFGVGGNTREYQCGVTVDLRPTEGWQLGHVAVVEMVDRQVVRMRRAHERAVAEAMKRAFSQQPDGFTGERILDRFGRPTRVHGFPAMRQLQFPDRVGQLIRMAQSNPAIDNALQITRRLPQAYRCPTYRYFAWELPSSMVHAGVLGKLYTYSDSGWLPTPPSVLRTWGIA